MKNQEHTLQKACIQWFRMQHPNLLLFAIPNGGQRSKVTGKMLKDEGVLAGVPDLFLACPSGKFAGLFIEMKVRPNSPSAVQLKLLNSLYLFGYMTTVCYTFDEFMVTIKEYLCAK